MHFNIVTIFPDWFTSPLSTSLLQKALNKGILSVEVHNLRDYAPGIHRATDDMPYGGGVGMVMTPEPLINAVEATTPPEGNWRRVLLSPQGQPLSQQKVADLAKVDGMTLVCGRYEGVDERFLDFVDDEISIGDYIVSGGEVAAFVLIDSVARLIPGVIGKEQSTEEESFSDGLLEYPQYTRPETFRGMKVPKILLSGHHANIGRWRRRQALLRTRQRRPDLIRNRKLSAEELDWIQSNSGKDV